MNAFLKQNWLIVVDKEKGKFQSLSQFTSFTTLSTLSPWSSRLLKKALLCIRLHGAEIKLLCMDIVLKLKYYKAKSYSPSLSVFAHFDSSSYYDEKINGHKWLILVWIMKPPRLSHSKNMHAFHYLFACVPSLGCFKPVCTAWTNSGEEYLCTLCELSPCLDHYKRNIAKSLLLNSGAMSTTLTGYANLRA